MVEADPVMRAARNGFLIVILALLLVWASKLAFVGENDVALFALWALGAAVFYGSKYYYERQADDASDESADAQKEHDEESRNARSD